MSNFLELTQFEFKKMLCKKSVCIVSILSIILTVFRYVGFVSLMPREISGVNYFIGLADTTILIIFLITSICIAPLFAEEYTTRVDKLILASKNGKSRLIRAKIIVGISVAVGLVGVLFLVSYIGTLWVWGFETSSQEEWRTFWIYISCAFIGNVFSAVICMLFSAKFKSTYSAIVVSFLFIMVTRILYFPESAYLARAITQLLPIQMATLSTASPSFYYSIAGIHIATYQLIPFVAIGFSSIMIPAAYQIFKNHQSY